MRRRLLVPLVLGVIASGALLAASLHDLLTGRNPIGTWTVYFVQDVSGQTGDHPVIRTAQSVHASRVGGVASAAQWWRSTPTLVVAVAVLALLVATLVVVARYGADSPRASRVLWLTGLLALIGGPVAVLVAALAPQWAHGNWMHTTLWPQALIWSLIGAGLLAIRELLARANVIRSELDGVI